MMAVAKRSTCAYSKSTWRQGNSLINRARNLDMGPRPYLHRPELNKLHERGGSEGHKPQDGKLARHLLKKQVFCACDEHARLEILDHLRTKGKKADRSLTAANSRVQPPHLLVHHSDQDEQHDERGQCILIEAVLERKLPGGAG